MRARVPFKNSVSKKRLAEAEEFIHSELKKGQARGNHTHTKNYCI